MVAVAGLVASSPVTVGVNYFGAKATLQSLRPLLAGSDAPPAVVVASLAALEEIDSGLLGHHPRQRSSGHCARGDEPPHRQQ